MIQLFTLSSYFFHKEKASQLPKRAEEEEVEEEEEEKGSDLNHSHQPFYPPCPHLPTKSMISIKPMIRIPAPSLPDMFRQLDGPHLDLLGLEQRGDGVKIDAQVRGHEGADVGVFAVAHQRVRVLGGRRGGGGVDVDVDGWCRKLD
jgi:hypothetical protein